MEFKPAFFQIIHFQLSKIFLKDIQPIMIQMGLPKWKPKIKQNVNIEDNCCDKKEEKKLDEILIKGKQKF